MRVVNRNGTVPQNIARIIQERGLKQYVVADRAGYSKQQFIDMNRPLSSRQMKKEKLCHEGLVPVSKGSQTL